MAKWVEFSGKVLADTYRVGDILGKGGMGAVYEAVNIRIDKRFAIKVLSPEAVENSDVVKRFRREAMIASDLGHPHIVYIVDFNETEDGISYIVMEHLEGDDLADLLDRKGALSVTRAATIACQVCSALQAVHEKKVIHRDLKPANIFLCANEEGQDFIKVLDFGISKIIGTKGVTTLTTKDNVLLGTPHFMSPEQIGGNNKAIGPWTDIFALGTILYQMVSGRPAFDADTLLGLIFKVANHDPPPPSSLKSNIPPEFDAVVARAMAKDPRARYTSMKELAMSLRRAARLPLPVDSSLDATLPGELVSSGTNHPGGSVGAPSLKALSTLSRSVAEVVEDETMPSSEAPLLAKRAKVLVLVVVTGLLVGMVAYTFYSAPAGAPHMAARKNVPEVAPAPLPADARLPDRGTSQEPQRPARVSLEVRCVPAAARIEVDGQVQTKSPAVFDLSTSEEPVQIHITAKRYQPLKSTWVPGESGSLDFELKRLLRRPKRKKIFSKPSFAD